LIYGSYKDSSILSPFPDRAAFVELYPLSAKFARRWIFDVEIDVPDSTFNELCRHVIYKNKRFPERRFFLSHNSDNAS
ncbi:MAG: hypothetical protein ACI39U_02185, partial [Candidatus Cryptobacteroides sp.]